MIQVGTILNVIDNSGAKKVRCIKVLLGYKNSFASVGETVTIAVQSIRNQRKMTSKTRKGEIYKALIVRTKIGFKYFSGERLKFLENSVVLLGKQNKCIGTRIIGSVPSCFRYNRFVRILSIAGGLVK